MSKRTYSEHKGGDDNSDEMVGFGDLPHSVIFAYLEPLDLLACCYVNKSSRRDAGRALNNYQYDPQTVCQQMMFAQWLKNPVFPKGHNQHQALKDMMGLEKESKEKVRSYRPYDIKKEPKEGLVGPLRLKAIKPNLEQNFVILDSKRTYMKETSTVAIFDNAGGLVAIYKFCTPHYYEQYVDKNVMCGEKDVCFNRRGGSNFGVAGMWMKNSGQFRSRTKPVRGAWTIDWHQLEWAWQEGFMGEVTLANYAIIRLFHGELSPMEVTTVLMHALSSDSRAIFTYMKAVFDNFGCRDIGFYGNENDADTKAWIDQLKNAVYQ